jgi:hypothetical protein
VKLVAITLEKGNKGSQMGHTKNFFFFLKLVSKCMGGGERKNDTKYHIGGGEGVLRSTKKCHVLFKWAPLVKSPVKFERFQSMSTACGGNMDSFMTVRIDSKVPMLQAVLLQQQAGAGSGWDIMGISGSVWLILGFSGLQMRKTMGTPVFRYSGPQQRSLDSSKS